MIIENKRFDKEREFYDQSDLQLRNCQFDGVNDGESAMKEGKHIQVENCFFNLRYPFWHDDDLTIKNSSMSELCRAALWYSNQITIENTKLHGIKALRECEDVRLVNCDIISAEFGWSIKNMEMQDSKAVSEYFMMRSENLNFAKVDFKGKYSFQYIKNATFEDCVFDTKDAFWHSDHVTVKNSVIKGEYLAWYSDHLTLINCKIIGTQPFCYCKNLKLIDCEMIDTDLCFEKSQVQATITTPIISIKNAGEGKITVPAVNELIMDDPLAHCEIIITGKEK